MYHVLALIVPSIVVLLISISLLRRRAPLKSLRTMIVLGSGGHTSEMFRFLKTLNLKKYSPRIYVHALSDAKSKDKVVEFEKSNYSILTVPRSREVGQSYFSSIFTTLWSLIISFAVVFQSSPDVILANGPGTCLPILLSGWMMRILGKNNRLVLLESYACVQNISLTAKLARWFVDMYCVQWAELACKYSAIYTGRIQDKFQEKTLDFDKNSYVLVTVGSTKFEELISTVDCAEFVEKMKSMGFRGLHIQYGNSNYKPKFLASTRELEIRCYSYCSGWDEEVRNCSLVVGHSGAGTILDSLENEKPIIVVPNDRLMNKHQSEMSLAMKRLGYLEQSSLEQLVPEFEILVKSLSCRRLLPKTESNEFSRQIECLANKKL